MTFEKFVSAFKAAEKHLAGHVTSMKTDDEGVFVKVNNNGSTDMLSKESTQDMEEKGWYFQLGANTWVLDL